MKAIGWSCIVILMLWTQTRAEVLEPPNFNLATGKEIRATATCGVDEDADGIDSNIIEPYCLIVGSHKDTNTDVYLNNGQICSVCDKQRPDKWHPASKAIDGTNDWWMSPPLSRGIKYNEVNLTIDLGREFHVAYISILMAISPLPGVWALERSTDYGKTYQPWQYFADSSHECMDRFGVEASRRPVTDDSVLCVTEFSKVLPINGGQIIVPLLTGRPSADKFANSTALQEWTKATNIRLRLIRTKTLFGHLQSVAQQDPTVTRRYFYAIKDISIGGKCVCNGHADKCDEVDPNNRYRILCNCKHNTTGINCERCRAGYVQKPWRPSKPYDPFICEPCNCYGHSDKCEYDAAVDRKNLSLDVHGKYDGGGVCKHCKHNTEGINCNKCKPGFYRPKGRPLNAIDVCERCKCNENRTTGNCKDGDGQCECRPQFHPPHCNNCSHGYFGYPNCRPCDCNLNRTEGGHCSAEKGHCYCKKNFSGKFCNSCADGYFHFPHCLPCECNLKGANHNTCDNNTGQCVCKKHFGERNCDKCKDGYFGFPKCSSCRNCDKRGTTTEICNKKSGKCLCKEGYTGKKCEQCSEGRYMYPKCIPCGCNNRGSLSPACSSSGQCSCQSNYAGKACDMCNAGYYQYPDCLDCKCNLNGSIGMSCDDDGICPCQANFTGIHCDKCKQGYFNFPVCEACNCDPKGVKDSDGGCESLPTGELCPCKKHVKGRICNECKPHYWNIQAANPDGCEDCECYLPGVDGGIGECNSVTGQCNCKLLVHSQQCKECINGTFNLIEENILGCTDCGCDVGGSINNICDKETGQCQCKAHIEGRMCTEPEDGYYFPTLYQFQFEAEGGRTSNNATLHYEFDENVFHNFSCKGYAVFSEHQTEIILDININRSSIYYMIFHYVNLNKDSVLGNVMITQYNNADVDQKFEVLFKPSMKSSFVTVAGHSGTTPSPMIMDPGKWSIRIKNEKHLFLDYMVIIPSDYYEAGVLNKKVYTPCLDEEDKEKQNICRHYEYLDVSEFDKVQERALPKGGTKPKTNGFFTGFQLFSGGVEETTNEDEQEIQLKLHISKSGKYVLVIIYFNPVDGDNISNLSIEATSNKGTGIGQVALYPCNYTTFCRQVVQDDHGRIGIFDFNATSINLLLKEKEKSKIDIKTVIAIPYDNWSFDYIKPKSVCVMKDRKCIQTTFSQVHDSKKVEFESGIGYKRAKILPKGISNNNIGLIYLDLKDEKVDVKGKVSAKGKYVFVVHYYQPNFSGFVLDAMIHNGRVHEAYLNAQHCLSYSGCRSVVHEANGNILFNITDNFLLSLTKHDRKTVWLDYVIVIPAEIYAENILHEDNVDQTGQFINECGTNEFYIRTDSQGFCRNSVFSITSNYNNGTLPCECDNKGSLSLTCEKFGGQCSCKANVIGRKCELCKSRHYGFPKCASCDCPPKLLCDSKTGACFCPPRITGERCDRCEDYAYGFNETWGCKECGCNPKGVERGNLQCDLITGHCKCKDNIEGRTCDQCSPGYSSFPSCKPCKCDLRGTAPKICDEFSSKCLCKKNVIGKACQTCLEGTFNIEEKNPDGCTKCFCFGRASICTSSSLYKSKVVHMEDWNLAEVKVKEKWFTTHEVSVEIIDILPSVSENVIHVDLTSKHLAKKVVYFVAPDLYLGNKLTAYGGFLNYTISYSSHGSSDKAIIEADVILHGSNVYLLNSLERQPINQKSLHVSIKIMEMNFKFLNGSLATREQVLRVLQDLKGLYIRATYSLPSSYVKLTKVILETAEEFQDSTAEKALAVEQCSCPPNYQGLSCEECAPGYFRHKGNCILCQCNGHSNTCDPLSGVCSDCRNNTTGDNCEKCEKGYYGNATRGTPNDCMRCTCPLQITSNNFAEECELSSDKKNIKCDCLPQYKGDRCESCAPGFYGRPEIPGNKCKPCECSGNINSEDHESCDPVTGVCMKCLKNTSGEDCSVCAPGFFGDAVNLKNCRECKCKKCGTSLCDHKTGVCKCKTNVVGDKCDQCAPNHWDFNSCEGCLPCNCQSASESMQCDKKTGKCKCRPGVSGLTCDRCDAGFWNYSSVGCVSCGCNSEFSNGSTCNAHTGQCNCVSGLIGEKCNQCPSRWALVPQEGCTECDICIHILLNQTDKLAKGVNVAISDIKDVTVSYHTNQRLIFINSTTIELYPKVDSLVPRHYDIKPLADGVEWLKDASKRTYRMALNMLKRSLETKHEGSSSHADATRVERTINEDIEYAKKLVMEMSSLNFNTLDSGSEVESVQNILRQIQNINFMPNKETAQSELIKAQQYLNRVQELKTSVMNQTQTLEVIHGGVVNLDKKLDDLNNHGQRAMKNSEEANVTINGTRLPQLSYKVEAVKNLSKDVDSASIEGKSYLKNATDILNDIKVRIENISKYKDDLIKLKNEVNASMQSREKAQERDKELVKMAVDHAKNLMERAQEIHRLFSSTRNASEGAVKAANSYKNIVTAIEKAKKATDDAEHAANEAISMSKGFWKQTSKSGERSSELLNNAMDVLNNTQTQLRPKLENATKHLGEITRLNQNSESEEKNMNSTLKSIPNEIVKSLSKKASKTGKEASQMSKAVLRNISDIAERAPQDLIEAQSISEVIHLANINISQAGNEVEKSKSNLPELIDLSDKEEKKQSYVDARLSNIQKEIAKLRKNISRALGEIKRIEVGVTLNGSSTLVLKNPEHLSHLGTSANVSIYFRTSEENGFLLYLGNEIGTRKRLKRVATDDFMALEIENGFPILKIDLGSGTQNIISDKYVADNTWYQVIVDRTGKSLKLTIREESEDGEDILHKKEVVLPGTSSVLNLDQDLSKLFVGGYPATFKIQPDIQYSAFVGDLEELSVGHTSVSLWNFDEAENINGTKERDKLINLQIKTGLKFDGNGYVTLKWSPHQMRKKCLINLDFKTEAKDGLLFLVKNSHSFLSIELANGLIFFQFELGDGMATLKSESTYNDGKWHSVEAVRQNNEALLMVDKVNVDKGSSPGNAINLNISEIMYFGGYPAEHNLINVTNQGFDGCIDHVQIGYTPIDLSEYSTAFRVSPGCPEKIANIVSFPKNSSEHIKWNHIPTMDFLQVILKFNTTQDNALLFFVTDSSQSNTISLALVNGTLMMYGPKGKVRVSTRKTNPTKYNDGQWHAVTATYEKNVMHLHIDDYDSYKSKENLIPLEINDGTLYFGGVPREYDIIHIATPHQIPFVGCLGDITVNGKVIKFEDVTQSPYITLGKCDTNRYPYVEPSDDALHGNLQELTQRSDAIHTNTRYSLPLDLSKDSDINVASGYRLGTKPQSYLKYSQENTRIKHNISVEFNTRESDGVIFYTADDSQTNFLALFLKDGKMNYAFSCGEEATFIATRKTWNDGQWHSVAFSRHSSEAKLFIGHSIVKKQKTKCRTLKITNPIFLGGIPTTFRKDAQKNLMGPTNSFVGCLRNFRISGNLVEQPNTAQGVIPCSEKVEPGIFFPADGGYIRIADDFKVGKKIEIEMNVRPRKLDGLILSVHGKRDFLVLQMLRGKILFIVNNGRGSISTEYKPSNQNLLSDGNWHHIKVIKNKNTAILQVDGEQRDMKTRSDGASDTDTSNPLYMGGHPDLNSNLSGVKTREPFFGCIANLSINSVPMKLADIKHVGNVMLGACPTI